MGTCIMIDKRIEKLEDQIQDLTNKLEHVTTAVVILISKIDPNGYQDAFVDLNDDNVS